jgi:hypothetical protein
LQTENSIKVKATTSFHLDKRPPFPEPYKFGGHLIYEEGDESLILVGPGGEHALYTKTEADPNWRLKE